MVLVTVFAVATAQQPKHLLSFQKEHQNRVQKILFPENFRAERTFSENFWKAENLQFRGNISRSIIWNWDTVFCYDTDNVLSYRYTQTLNSTGNSLTELIENRTGTTWENDSRYSCTYDISGNMLTKLYESWNGASWESVDRETYTYDAAGNIITEIYESWEEGTWEVVYHLTYTYDLSGNMLTVLYERWNEDAWENIMRFTYTYDTENHLLTELYEYWNDGAWENIDRLTYTYNTEGDMATVVYEYWEEEAWVIGARLTYTYNAAGDILTELAEYLEGTWVNGERFTYTYDASGNILTELYEYWEEGIWENGERNTYTYDDNRNSITGTYEEWSGVSWEPAINSYGNIYSEQNIIGQIEDYYRYEASFASFNTGISETNTENNRIQLFPNPASDKVTINVTDVKGEYLVRIYNNLGFMVKSETANLASYEINTSALPAGMYIMEITGKDFSGKKKLIINK